MFPRFKFLIFFLIMLTIASCNKSREELLFRAAGQGDKEKVVFLLKNGVSIEAKDGLGYVALMKAASNGQGEVVKLLLVHKANANAITVFGSTALMQAAWNGHLKIVKLLVKNKADINMQGAGGWTALHFASLSGQGHAEIAQFLLEKGANPNTKDGIGMTPLQWINSGRYRPEIVKILHQYGAQG